MALPRGETREVVTFSCSLLAKLHVAARTLALFWPKNWLGAILELRWEFSDDFVDMCSVFVVVHLRLEYL